MPMTMPTPSEECLGRFEQMGASMVGQGVMSGKMFGMPIHKAPAKRSPVCGATPWCSNSSAKIMPQRSLLRGLSPSTRAARAGP